MRPPLTLELLATRAAVSGVRRALRDHMGAPCADLQLCASELVTNVVRHLGEGVPVTVRVVCDRRRTRLEVTDPCSRALPVLREVVTTDDEAGRGLALLDAPALRWGVSQGPGGKTVWCELAAPTSGGEGGRHPGRPGGWRGEAVGGVPEGVHAVVDPDAVAHGGPDRGTGRAPALQERRGEHFRVPGTDQGP